MTKRQRLLRDLRANSRKKDRDERRRSLARAIDNEWSSLRSHLADAASPRARVGQANPEFHAKCVVDYGFCIFVLARELFSLTQVDFKREYDTYGKRLT